METANVGSNKKIVTTNMVVTYPEKDGIEILSNGQIVNVKEYLEKVGSVKIGVLNNTERELRNYLAKYYPEKLVEYDKKVAGGKEGFEVGE